MIKHTNLFLIATLAICAQGLGGCAHKVESNENVAAHWTFDSAAGSRIEDKSGSNDCTVKGDTENGFIQKGLYGNAALFNKGRHIVSVPHSNDLSLTDDFMIECVIKPFKVRGFNTIIWKGYRKISPEEINYFVDIRDGKVELKTKDKEGKWSVFSTREPVLDVNKWYDIIITYKQGRVNFYVNGKKYPASISEKVPSKKTLLANKHAVNIGVGAATHVQHNYFFNGLIDDMKISRGTKVDISESRQKDFAKRVVKDQMTNLENNATKILDAAKNLKDLIDKDDSDDFLKDNDISNALSNTYANGLAANKALLDELNKQKNLIEYKNYFISSFGKNQPFALTTLLGVKRLVKKEKFYKDIKLSQTNISLKLARNEREGFQGILLGNPFNDLNDVKVTLEDLKHENGKDSISSKNIEWGPVASIETKAPEIAVDFTGKIPDVIMEGGEKVNVTKSDFTPVFFRIFADKKTVPGNYKGKIKFSHSGASKEITLNVEVYNFTLPEKNSLIVAFSFFEGFYQKWYGYKKLTDEQKMYIYKFLLKYRIPPNNIYSGEKCYPNVKFLEKLGNKGANFCTINSGRRIKDVSKKVEALRPTIEKLKEKGLYKDAYFYSFDELGCHMKGYDKAKELLSAIQKAYPDLRLMQTSFPTPKLAPLFNVWVPTFSSFTSKQKLKILDEMRKKSNGEIWWYNADFPRYPYPNYFIDYPLFDCRIIMSLSYMYKVKGILYWCINREWKPNNIKEKKWPETPWKPYIHSVLSKKRKYVNGMGNFTYPGPNGKIYPSLRLENFRDGIEDYEYYKLLEQKVADVKKNNPGNPLIKEAEKLLKLPANVATAVNNFSPNPENLLKHRQQVAEMIMRLSDEK
jgi:glycosyl hydrolase family 123/concanavalin A-like lectin/glucanase superfamily protein